MSQSPKNILHEIILAGENQRQEFKSSFSKEAIETITAFANSTGGSVYIGIDDRGNIKGVEIGKETLQNWQNQIKLNTRPSLFPDINVMDIDGKKIVSLSIQEHPIKPVSCRGKYYQRKKNANHQMTITEISDCHLKTFNTSWDFYQATTHTIEDISLNKINGFIARANAIRPFPINDDPLTVLKKFELLIQDKITNGSHLLFMAEESAISTIEAGRFSSDTIIKDSITIKTDLFSEVDLVFEFIKKHISRGYYFKGKAQREERWEYPLEAIREIIINMIVHRDYMSPGDSIIKIFDESIEFFNPGRLAGGLTAEQLTSGNYISAVRNKQIAHIFKEAGLIEKYGSGIKRVLMAFNEYQLKAPVFEDFQHGFRVTVCRTPQKPPQKPPQKDGVKTKILDFLMENPYLSQREVAEKLGISFDTAKEHFSKLKKENRIKRMGGRKNGFWNVL